MNYRNNYPEDKMPGYNTEELPVKINNSNKKPEDRMPVNETNESPVETMSTNDLTMLNTDDMSLQNNQIKNRTNDNHDLPIHPLKHKRRLTFHKIQLSTTRSGRLTRPPKKHLNDHIVSSAMKNISINKVLEGNRAKESRAAILEEIKVMIDYNVGHFQHFHEVPPEERNQILNTFMFIKNKETPDGKFERVKARLVANGKNQHEDLYDLISSSTVNTASVFLLMNIASLHKCSLVSYDIKGAFLHAQFQKQTDKDTYIRIQKEVATIWCEQQPEAS
jgi:hypothetical protein